MCQVSLLTCLKSQARGLLHGQSLTSKSLGHITLVFEEHCGIGESSGQKNLLESLSYLSSPSMIPFESSDLRLAPVHKDPLGRGFHTLSTQTDTIRSLNAFLASVLSPPTLI